MFKTLKKYKFDGGATILFLIGCAIFGKAVYSVDVATNGGKDPIVIEKVIEAAGPIESANHGRYND